MPYVDVFLTQEMLTRIGVGQDKLKEALKSPTATLFKYELDDVAVDFHILAEGSDSLFRVDASASWRQGHTDIEGAELVWKDALAISIRQAMSQSPHLSKALRGKTADILCVINPIAGFLAAKL